MNATRLIFRFRDGSELRAVDPIQVMTALAEHKTYLPRHLYEAADGVAEAQDIVASAACDAFGVQPFDGKKTGLTVAERVYLMLVFDTWTMALKKKHRELADDAALYGIDIHQLRREDYEAYVGLRLNRGRSMLRQAEVIRLGSTATLGSRRIGWFLANTDTEEEASFAYEQHVSEIAEQSPAPF